MSSAEDKTTLRLGRAEALVLFEMLADFYEQPCLAIKTNAERLALVRLQGALEGVMVEPFLPEYRLLVDEARLRLASEAEAV